jgi:hypothetical protein
VHTSGKTATWARHEYLKKQIPGETGPFSYVASFTKEDADEIIKDVQKDLGKVVVGILVSIRQSFERQKTNKQNDTPEGQKFRRDLHQVVDEARKVMNGVVAESLERCKAHK